MKKTYYMACDFETNNQNQEVYSWMCKNSKDNEFKYGNTIYSFLEYIVELNFDARIFFHNGAKFDYHFLYAKLKKERIFKEKEILEEPLDFKLLTDENFKIINLKLMNLSKKSSGKYRIVNFTDSNLIFPSSLAGYGKSLNKHFKTNIYTKEKSIDYDKFTEYKNVEEMENDKIEFDYLKQDVIILFDFLKIMGEILPMWKWKNTGASTAYHLWVYDFFGKKMLNYYIEKELIYVKKAGYFTYYRFKNHKKWIKENRIKKMIIKKIFPTEWLEKATLFPYSTNFNEMYSFYNGGHVNVNPNFIGKKVKNLVYIDINSSYPSQMYKYDFPIGELLPSKEGDLKFYIVEAKTDLINEKGLPFIFSLENSKKYYYKIIKKGTIFRLIDIELKALKKYYSGEITSSCLGSFRKKNGKQIFGDYIDYFYELKAKGKKEGNQAKVIFAKLGLNSLYGKFGQKMFLAGRKWNYETEKWELTQPTGEEKANYFLPMAIWITAYARLQLVNAIGENYETAIYNDTDSITVFNNSPILKNIELDKSKLGAWDVENKFKWGIFRRTKQYFCLTEENKYIFKYASIRENETNINHIKNNPELFIFGTEVKNQIRPKRLPNGIMLENFNKKIKPLLEFADRNKYWYNDELKLSNHWNK